MATDVKIRFRSFLPGGGFDSSGNPKQGKTRVVGELDVTSYSGQGGEPLSAADLGLSTIDAITLRNADEASGNLGGTGEAFRRDVIYSKTTGHFYLFTVDGVGDWDDLQAAQTETLEFVAEGDSAHDVELT